MNIFFQKWGSKPISRRIKKSLKTIDAPGEKISRNSISSSMQNIEVNNVENIEVNNSENLEVNSVEKIIKNPEHQKIIEDIEAIDLEFNSKKIIFSGSLQADILIIGECPEERDRMLNRPFLGECGKYLEDIFHSMQLNFRRCYLTNSIFWITPGGRPPTVLEITLCNPFLLRQIHIVQPKIILLLGVSALKSIAPNSSILEIRGQPQSIEILGNSYQFLATFHPNYLLKSQNYRSLIEEDIRNIKNCF